MAKILRIHGAEEKVGYKRSTIYDKIDPDSPRYDPSFPKPIRLGSRAIGFVESELDEWIAGRIQVSRSTDTDLANTKAGHRANGTARLGTRRRKTKAAAGDEVGETP